VRVIEEFARENGYAPTLEEIASRLGVTKITVFHLLARLKRKGVIRRGRYQTRSVELIASRSEDELPLKGRIAAGQPIEAVETPDTVKFSEMFPAEKGRYVLRVQGDSMIDEHICDGDYVIIQPRQTAESGEVVVALLDNGEATLKRFYREPDRIRLQPANPDMKPIYVGDVRILGVVVGVLRKY
jgi:repressor LexA